MGLLSRQNIAMLVNYSVFAVIKLLIAQIVFIGHKASNQIVDQLLSRDRKQMHS